MNQYQIAIVGAGPGGLSAGAQAAKTGLSHIVLEAGPDLANTIQHYQKHKQVMDEPALLPVRSQLPFSAGKREAVLEGWARRVAKLGVNLAYNSEVLTVSGRRGHFILRLKNGDSLRAERVVLAVGLQGNLRRLEIPGDDLPGVQYQLDDPDAYQDETILVVGAGDSAIENALALSARNTVVLVNRRDEFARAKQANLDAVLHAVKREQIDCLYRSRVERIEPNPGPGRPLLVTLKTPDASAQMQCDRVIARLGAAPPRRFLEDCGVRFASADPGAVPLLSPQYESNPSGLYIIGALAGYPLIKQAINQGHEVIEFIRGHKIDPVDEPLLREKFRALPVSLSVDAALGLIRQSVPLLSGLSGLQLREFMLESELRLPKPGQVIFHYNDYTNSIFSIVSGEVRIPFNRNDPSQIITLRQGQFFGEMGLISGRRRTATVYAGSGQQCVLIETPRRTMLRMLCAVESVRRTIDQVFVLRAIQSHIAPEIPASDLAAVVHSARIQQFSAGDVIYQEGDSADCLHLIRLGSATLSRNIGGDEVVLAYVAAGNYLGEMALLADLPRSETARAAVATESIRLEAGDFKALLARHKSLRHQVEAKLQQRLAQHAHMQDRPQAGNIISFMVSQGLGEATDVLLINETLCIGCDNCEKACAETHGGTSRLNREAGPTYASVHVPTSCRHCEHPHCMKDCPPDAIHRAPNGEVYIADNCVGCGNCRDNCPYGVIQMALPNRHKPGLFAWLMFGAGPGPGGALPETGKTEPKAVKCDMCKDLGGGPACVRACPTGAAARVSPEEFMRVAARE